MQKEKDLILDKVLPENKENDGDRNSDLTLWKLLEEEQWQSISLLVEKQLITASMLSYKREDDVNEGINILWMMAWYGQWDLIKILAEQELITTETLLSRPERSWHENFGYNVLNMLACYGQWNLIELLASEINTELLLAKVDNDYAPNVLEAILQEEQFGLIKKLLTTPLAPLFGVPWTLFYTLSMMLQFIAEDDIATLTALIELGVPPPMNWDNPNPEIRTLFEEAKPRLPHKLAVGSDIDVLNYKFQARYWDRRACTMIEQEAFSAGMLFADFEKETKSQLPEVLKWLILFYALGDQQGMTKGFVGSLDLSSLEKTPKFKLPKFKDHIDRHFQRGEKFFATIHSSLRSQLDPHLFEESDERQFWTLACDEKWPLVKTKIETQEKSINLSMLLFKASEAYTEQGINTLWWIAYCREWALIESLLNKGLITSQMLLSMPQHPFHLYRGINVVWWIVFSGEWELMRMLLKDGLIMTSTLFSRPADEKNSHFGCHVLNEIVFNQQWDLIDLLIPEINTELLLLKRMLHGSNVLELILKEQQFGLIKKLLKAPLAPLDEVPWTKFNTSSMMLQFIKDDDVVTLTALIGLGVPPPMEWDTPNQEIRTLFEEVKPRLPHKLAGGFLKNGIPGVVEFHHQSQRDHWRWRAKENMKQEVIFAGALFAVFQKHTNTTLTTDDLIRLILFYALGDQQGITYRISYTLDSAACEIPSELDYKIGINKHFQKGFGMFADLTGSENNRETVLPVLTY